MGEFSRSDAIKWLQTAMNNNCGIQKAIYYCLYFRCQKDEDLFKRALEFFSTEMGVKVPDCYPT